MISTLRSLLVLVLLLALAAPAVAAEQLFLWKIEGDNATIHMTGTIHVGRDDFYPLPDALEEAFADSDVLAVEVDMTDPAVMQSAAVIMMSKGMLPDKETLRTSLAPEVWDKLVAYAVERDIDLGPFAKLRPSLAAMMLVMEEYKRQGLDETLGIDVHFLNAAREDGKEIRQLETIESQMALFMDMTDSLDDILVLEVIEQADQIVEFTDTMIAAWRTGDAAALDELLQDQMGDDPEMEEFYRKLLDNRNVAMVDQVDEWARGNEDVFVAVGAGHYGGEMGMLKLLEDKGWEVRQISR